MQEKLEVVEGPHGPRGQYREEASLSGRKLVLTARAVCSRGPGEGGISPSLEVCKQRLRGLELGILTVGVRLAPPLRLFLL